jgi:hypothetical protein
MHTMKNLFALLLLFIMNFTVFSQKEGEISYTKVVYVDSSLKSIELYNRARSWFAESYRSSNDVIQLEDKDEGKIIGKGSIRYISSVYYGSEGTKGWIRYTLSVQVKDGRYKYELTNFIHEGNPLNSGGQLSFGLITNEEECPREFKMTNRSWRNKVWNDIKRTVEIEAEILINSLENAMENPADSQKDDW